MNTSPPSALYKEDKTVSTASFKVNKNLLHSGDVTLIFSPFSIRDFQRGIKDPLEAITFPYRTDAKIVPEDLKS